MTIEPMSQPTPGRPKGSVGNGKTLKEIAAREERNLARMRTQQTIAEARNAAEDLGRIAELKAKQRARLHEQYNVQESKRAPQFQIDQTVTLWTLGALSAIMFIATAILSADGTIGAAITAHYAVSWFGYLLFGAVEIAVLVFMLTYYVLGSRIDYEGNPIKATPWFIAMIVAAGAAVALSVFHVLDVYRFDFTSIDLWVGVGIRLVTTVFFVIVSKALATVLFARAIQF